MIKGLINYIKDYKKGIGERDLRMIEAVARNCTVPSNIARKMFGRKNGRGERIWSAIASGVPSERCMPMLLSPKSHLFLRRIGKEARRLGAVSQLNRKVHAAWYKRIVEKEAMSMQ
eukprot:2616450-Rhodomonas_salina.1